MSVSFGCKHVEMPFHVAPAHVTVEKSGPPDVDVEAPVEITTKRQRMSAEILVLGRAVNTQRRALVQVVYDIHMVLGADRTDAHGPSQCKE